MSIEHELEHLICARYPIVCLLTSEETRVTDLVHAIAARRQKQVFEWSCTTGLAPAGTSIQSQRQRASPTKDPLAALDQVIDQVEPALFVFKDFHPFLAKTHYAVIRRLREIALHLKNSRKTILLVAPTLDVPPELEKEVTVLPYPLPNPEELGLLLDRILSEVAAYENVTVDLDETGRDRLLQAARGLTLAEAENVFAKVVVKYERISGLEVQEVFAEKQQIVRKNGLLEYCATGETFDTIGGLAVLKDWLRKRAAAFTAEARAFGLPAPKGILLLGVQGCGKSLCAKAVANLWQLPLLRFDVGRLFGSLVGSSEENVRRAIAVAESVAPAVLWVDEIDKAFAGAGGSTVADGGTTARVFATWLTWLAEKTAPVFIVATANDIAQLPPELLRKGRFDEIFFVDLPSADERRDILEIHLAKRGRDPERFQLERLVAAADGYSGAEIESAIVSGLYDAFDLRQELATHHVQTALAQTVPLAKTLAEHIQRLRQWAAGRARTANQPRTEA